LYHVFFAVQRTNGEEAKKCPILPHSGGACDFFAVQQIDERSGGQKMSKYTCPSDGKKAQ
jgi:hypothetical protein